MQDADAHCAPEAMDAEDMLYILYTSGTTGKPKGIVHTTGGYLVGTYATTKWVFDLKETDVYWCTADIGWVTGHSYVVYGPLANGATVLMYEGAPDWPKKDRFWQLIERYGVTIFYTAPTAIRAFMRWGTEWPASRDLVDAAPARIGWRADQSRSVDLVSPEHRPRALPGRRHVVADRDRHDHDHAASRDHEYRRRDQPPTRSPASPRRFAMRRASRSQRGARTARADQAVAGDAARHLRRSRAVRRRRTWTRWPDGVYFTGDGARVDADGYYWLLGRVDDVLNVAGHRLGTMEVESALVDHPSVAEAAVVGKPHEIKGQAVAAFVTLKEGIAGTPALVDRAERARRPQDRRDRASGSDSSSPRTCRRPARARSCGGCCGTSPKARSLATRRPWRIRQSWRG